jgi:ribonuclease R
MTYTGVQAVLDKTAHEDEEYKRFEKEILLMDELCDILNNKRRKRGSIDFDMPEAEAVVDKDGNPILIKKAQRLKAHKIIEEFMLLANETVAEHIFWLNYPCIYRVHEEPETDKLSELKDVLASMGHKINIANMHPKKISELLDRIKDKPEEDVIKNIVLKSMQRAEYSSKNTGHFGIAAKFYTHFTSPIRRYSDLIVHRILSRIIAGNVDEHIYSDEQLSEISGSISKKERISVKAEREIMRIKMAKYLSDKIGCQYKAVISHITMNGFFAELENLIEGFVPFSYMDDYYISDLKRFLFYNERNGRVYKLGQSVNVKLVETDIIEGRCIFVMLISDKEESGQ